MNTRLAYAILAGLFFIIVDTFVKQALFSNLTNNEIMILAVILGVFALNYYNRTEIN